MNTIGARLVFENAKAAINKAFPIPASNPNRGPASELCKLTQSFLRLEQPLSATRTEYEFPILVNQTQLGMFNTEQRLNLQDSFVTSEIGFFTGLPASATDAAFVPDSYANPFIYGANAVPLQTVWNGGKLSITVNNDILVPSWDLNRHYYAPETQQTAAPGAGSPLDQKRLAVDGFYPMEPNVVFIGSKNNIIKINLAAPPATVSSNSRLILIFRGVLAQNSTVVS